MGSKCLNKVIINNLLFKLLRSFMNSFFTDHKMFIVWNKFWVQRQRWIFYVKKHDGEISYIFHSSYIILGDVQTLNPVYGRVDIEWTLLRSYSVTRKGLDYFCNFIKIKVTGDVVEVPDKLQNANNHENYRLSRTSELDLHNKSIGC